MKIQETTTRAITATWNEDELGRFLLAFDRWQARGTAYDEASEDQTILIDFYNDMSEALGDE